MSSQWVLKVIGQRRGGVLAGVSGREDQGVELEGGGPFQAGDTGRDGLVVWESLGLGCGQAAGGSSLVVRAGVPG